MSYFLRKSNKSKGIYLQMYETVWNSETKKPKSRCIETFGYVKDLVSEDIPNPVVYYEEYVRQKNFERKAFLNDSMRPRAFGECVEKNIGYFLLHTLIEELEVKKVIDILAGVTNFRFSVYDMITQLIYARVISPCSKLKTVSDVFPQLYRYSPMSEDQVYDGLEFIGGFYNKYIELFNHQYEKFYKRDYSRVFFDCTNYYFEIDLPNEDRQKGPSKENRHCPIIGQALLLDSDLVPLGMEMFPGNESEKPYIRKNIEEMKRRYKVDGRTVQVADKGLNCARNIYAAVKEADDGYIFSKSIHGKGLSKTEKEWLLLENSANTWTDYTDEKGNLKYRLKSCIDDFKYEFEEKDSVTGKSVKTSFTVREKRIVSYNPSLAKKQKAEIQKMADKAADCITFKKFAREELGDAAKYVKIVSKDNDGKKIATKIEMDSSKLDEDLALAGYNLMVTSELTMSPEEVYATYHNLWKIEESFRITKSYLDARPVYVQKKETIYGHFLICYLSLFLLRVLEIKCFKNQTNAYDIINFIRDFRVAKIDDNSYLNLAKNRDVNHKLKNLTGISILDALYLSQKELDTLLDSTMLIDS